MRRLRIVLLCALTFVQLSPRLVFAFEFDLANHGGKSNGFMSPVQQFAPIGPASAFIDEADDNAGFISGANIGAKIGGGSPPGTRRLIQPPPLKKRAFDGAADNGDDLQALSRRRRPSGGTDYYVEMPTYYDRYYFLNRI